MPIWRVIDANLCTLFEAQTLYSHSDIIEFNLFLDYKDALEYEAEQRNEGIK